MDEQLRRRSVGAPAARSLLLTILGEYVLPRGEAVWQETLVGALVSVGYTQQAARQALARSVRDGWLVTSRHGRRARVALSDATAGLLRTGAARIYSFGGRGEWDGRWLVVVLRVPEERREVRHQLRTRLAWAGLGSMGGGVWLTPHVEREAELREAMLEAPAAEATSFVASLGRARGRAGRSSPRPPGISTRCGRRTRRSSRTSPRSDPRRPSVLPYADAARARLAEVPVPRPRPARRAAARRLAAPAGVRAVRGASRALAGAARAYFEELEAGRGAQAA